MMTPAAIARRIGAPIDEVEWGIEELSKPDPLSKSLDHEGRRIKALEGSGYGWEILNFESYRAMRSADDMREKTRLRVQRYREKQKDVTQCNADVTQCNASNTKQKQKQKQSTEAEYRSSEESTFAQFWEIYPRKVGKGAARKAFAKACKRAEAQCIIDALKEQVESPHAFTEPKYSPHASTWLNRDGWEDELEAAQSKNNEF